jgi:hypothetical protein
MAYSSPYPSGVKYPYNFDTSAASMMTGTIPNAVKQKILTFSKPYNKPTKPVIEIYDNDFELLHTYNSFTNKYKDPSINISYCQVRRAAEQTNDFTIRFFDHKNEIDKSKVTTGAWVIIKGGRDETKLKSFLWGKVTANPFERGRLSATYFELQGEGSMMVLGNTMVRINKIGELRDVLANRINYDDQNIFACNVVREILESEDVLLGLDVPIRDRGHFKFDLYEKTVTDPIPIFNVRSSDALSVIKSIAEMTGAYFFVDGDNQVHFTYGNLRHSGVRVKQFIEEEAQYDMADKTSYYHGRWTGNKTTQKPNGFANILLSETGKLRRAISFSQGTDSFFNCWDKDLAQQIKVDNKFTDVTIWLTKSGEGSPSKDKFKGRVVGDNNGFPTGAKLGSFEIPMPLIPEGSTPKAFFIPNVASKSNSSGNNTFVWIIFWEIGDSDERTVNVWHDNVIDKPTEFKSMVRALPNGASKKRDKDDPRGWELINEGNGPQFAFSAVESLDLDFMAVDNLSVSKYGEFEAPFDVPWSNELLATARAMSAALYESSKPKLDYSLNEVFIPLDYYFDPLDIITIEDEMSGHTKAKTVTARIGQSTITWNANEMTTGTYWMEVLPMGFYNPVYDILDKDFIECEA